jgi:hypothetical protein
MWVWILVGLAILVILFYSSPRENMSNEDLVSTLKTFGDKSPAAQSIYGPSAAPPPLATNTGGSTSGQSVGGPYPQIFGPDVTNAPGSISGGMSANNGNGSNGTGTSASGGAAAGYVFSDQPGPQDQTYEFNPELKKAFPVDGPPQPFLTDFSKIQH